MSLLKRRSGHFLNIGQRMQCCFTKLIFNCTWWQAELVVFELHKQCIGLLVQSSVTFPDEQDSVKWLIFVRIVILSSYLCVWTGRLSSFVAFLLCEVRDNWNTLRRLKISQSSFLSDKKIKAVPQKSLPGKPNFRVFVQYIEDSENCLQSVLL